jgi:hypothetical protein
MATMSSEMTALEAISTYVLGLYEFGVDRPEIDSWKWPY